MIFRRYLPVVTAIVALSGLHGTLAQDAPCPVEERGVDA